MTKYLIQASKDGNAVDFEKVIKLKEKPNWFEMIELCDEHGCPWYTVYELDNQGNIVDTVEC